MKRKHGVLQRASAALGVLILLITTVLVLIFDFTVIFAAFYIAALAAIIGPAFAEGASSLIEILTVSVELVFEGIAMIFEFFTSLFSGF